MVTPAAATLPQRNMHVKHQIVRFGYCMARTIVVLCSYASPNGGAEDEMSKAAKEAVQEYYHGMLARAIADGKPLCIRYFTDCLAQARASTDAHLAVVREAA